MYVMARALSSVSGELFELTPQPEPGAWSELRMLYALGVS